MRVARALSCYHRRPWRLTGLRRSRLMIEAFNIMQDRLTRNDRRSCLNPFGPKPRAPQDPRQSA
jgi:hypothetical protein